MGFRFDDESRDSLDAGRSATESFSMLRARKRELLEEQRSGWAEGRPAPPEEFLGRWPTDPDSDPDAASLLLEDYLQRRRRGEEGSLAEYQERFPEQSQALEGLLAQETRLSLDGPARARARDSRSACPTWATRSSASACAGPWARARSPGCSWRSRPTWPAARSS